MPGFRSHLLVDGSAVGRLHQHSDVHVGQLPDVTRGQRRPSLPGVDVLAADGHHGPVVLVAALADEAAPGPGSSVTEESEHGVAPHLPGTETRDRDAAVRPLGHAGSDASWRVLWQSVTHT